MKGKGKDASPAKSWRDVLPIHPAAELFPLMSEAELRELGEDIKTKKRLTSSFALIYRNGRHELLDGRNRLDAMELVGIPIRIEFRAGVCFLSPTTLRCSRSMWWISIPTSTSSRPTSTAGI
jgi:hypothetical protein